LRTKTGVDNFDLPTEAEWEYACRAGTTTYYNDGLGTPANTTSNAQMNVLGRYLYNGGAEYADQTPESFADVGSYIPNAWGIYDMHGNVYEWCLDWWSSSLAGGVDPVGPETGGARVWRSGHLGLTAGNCRAAYRSNRSPTSNQYGCGGRISWRRP
jgi:formylglycine-generating enzyme required for sulfatase activity